VVVVEVHGLVVERLVLVVLVEVETPPQLLVLLPLLLVQRTRVVVVVQAQTQQALNLLVPLAVLA
jgi:hypothetical protein